MTIWQALFTKFFVQTVIIMIPSEIKPPAFIILGS